MRSLFRRPGLILAFIVIPVFTSFAWDSSGHNTAGAIAYYYLKIQNPSVLKKVLQTLKLHPWYASRWHEQLAGLNQNQQEIALFMLASMYPDDAKKIAGNIDGDVVHKTWHYVDYPYSTDSHYPGAAPSSPNAEEKITGLMNSLKNIPESSQKAIDVCWLFHLVEDVHQPLHSASLFNQDFPHGDAGGNDTYIRFSANTKPVKLHTYWDGLVNGTFANIPQKAWALVNNPIYSIQNLTEITQHPSVHDWIFTESFSDAKSVVYGNGSIHGTETNPTVVNNTYISVAKKLGEKRVVLSGLRLSKILMTLYI